MMVSGFWKATAVLVGTVVGVGIFGIPFSFAKAGFGIGFLFLLLVGGLTLLLHLLFGEIVLRTNGKHQLTGYARIYYGEKLKKFMLFAVLLSFYGALLAYIIIAGDFLENILSPFFNFSSVDYSTFFWIALSFLVYGGLKRVAKIDMFVSLIFSAVIISIFALGFSKVSFDNFTFFNNDFWFLPYGVLFFAFGGASAIPLQSEILGNNKRLLKKAIILGTLIPAVIYLIFAFTVVGVSGEITTPEAVSGLFDFLGEKIVIFASIFGTLTITTAFLGQAQALIETFNFDYGFRKSISWLIAVLVPYLLFLAGVRNFIDVISLVGAVAVGFQGIAVILIYRKARKLGQRTPEFKLNIPTPIIYLAMLLFILGVGYVFVN